MTFVKDKTMLREIFCAGNFPTICELERPINNAETVLGYIGDHPNKDDIESNINDLKSTLKKIETEIDRVVNIQILFFGKREFKPSAQIVSNILTAGGVVSSSVCGVIGIAEIHKRKCDQNTVQYSINPYIMPIITSCISLTTVLVHRIDMKILEKEGRKSQLDILKRRVEKLIKSFEKNLKKLSQECSKEMSSEALNASFITDDKKSLITIGDFAQSEDSTDSAENKEEVSIMRYLFNNVVSFWYKKRS